MKAPLDASLEANLDDLSDGLSDDENEDNEWKPTLVEVPTSPKKYQNRFQQVQFANLQIPPFLLTAPVKMALGIFLLIVLGVCFSMTPLWDMASNGIELFGRVMRKSVSSFKKLKKGDLWIS